ncbi:MAG: hypothetical protein HYY46_03765 [Deltaproteobacteria bacterium]|nr:hypothetical protein [Deltaproteobacteria bacterium]
MKAMITVLALVWYCLGVSSVYAQAQRVTIVGGPPAGLFGIFATGIGTYLSKTVPNLDVSVAATGGSVENVRRVNAGEAEMGLSFSSDVHESYYEIPAPEPSRRRNEPFARLDSGTA